MTDFTVLRLDANAGAAVTDASPTWNNMTLGGANYEIRVCGTGAGGASIASASWPTFLRPGAVGVIPEMWVYLGADATGGLQVKTYDGTTAHYMQFRWDWDVNGTFASAPLFSAWGDNTYAAAVPGTQPGAFSGSPIVNGHATDTGSYSYLHANAYGYGYSAGQQTPAANAAGTLAANSHSAVGAATTSTGAWLATWQDLQASTNWIADGVVPTAVTAGFWYFVIALYTGPNMSGGTLVPVLGFQYSWV